MLLPIGFRNKLSQYDPKWEDIVAASSNLHFGAHMLGFGFGIVSLGFLAYISTVYLQGYTSGVLLYFGSLDRAVSHSGP